MKTVDRLVEKVLESVIGTVLPPRVRILANLPVKKGGLGVRNLTTIANAAHLASFYLAVNLAENLLTSSELPVHQQNVPVCLQKMPHISPDENWGVTYSPSQQTLMKFTDRILLAEVFGLSSNRERAILRSRRAFGRATGWRRVH